MNCHLVMKVSIRPLVDSFQAVNLHPVVHSKRNRLWIRLHRMIDRDYLVKLYDAARTADIAQTAQAIATTLISLKRVQKYKLCWNEDSPFTFQPFFRPLLEKAGWRHSLRELSLRVPITELSYLVSVHLPHLEELDIRFSTGALAMKDIAIVLDAFTVFVDNLSPSLTGLTITSTNTSSNLDLSDFFHHLGTFPFLRCFTLSLPFDGNHLSRPIMLRRFILKHKRLAVLKLGTGPATPRDTPSLFPDAPMWIQNTCTPSLDLPLLHDLTFALRPLSGPKALSHLLPMLRPNANGIGLAHQLQSLHLTDRALTLGEVERVLQALVFGPHWPSQLETLGLRVQMLTPRLVDIIASYLPTLAVLELTPLAVGVDNVVAASRAVQLVRFG